MQPISFSELKFLILSDLHRYRNETDIKSFVKEFAYGFGFKYFLWWRINQYFRNKSVWLLPVRVIVRYILRRNSINLGIDISSNAEIGPGFKIEHFCGIIINGKAKIGKRCSILQGVTIGEYFGAPVIGDFVFIGPGAKLIGPHHVGNNVIIGANCVITKDIPNNAVVVGIPGTVISNDGNIRKERQDIFSSTMRIYRSLCPLALLQKYGLDRANGQ